MLDVRNDCSLGKLIFEALSLFSPISFMVQPVFAPIKLKTSAHTRSQAPMKK